MYDSRNLSYFPAYAHLEDPIWSLAQAGGLSSRHALSYFSLNPEQVYKHPDPTCVFATQVSPSHSGPILSVGRA